MLKSRYSADGKKKTNSVPNLSIEAAVSVPHRCSERFSLEYLEFVQQKEEFDVGTEKRKKEALYLCVMQ